MTRLLIAALLLCLAMGAARAQDDQGSGQGQGQGQGGGQGGGWEAEGDCMGEGAAIQVRLVVDGTLVWKRPAAEIVGLPGSMVIEQGQQEGLRAIGLADLVPPEIEHGRIGVVACDGEAYGMPVAELRRERDLWTLVETRRGFLKLVRAGPDDDPGSPVLRDVRLIEVRL